MTDPRARIRSLDLTLFDRVDTQTNPTDRRALLGVQRAIMERHEEFSYLEIGSHLGGSIQPYLVAPQCTRIYSIDPRPYSQPDERRLGHTEYYPDNSTESMLENLRSIDREAVSKITCFESAASEVDKREIGTAPMVAFIDGEHTDSAASADYAFCRDVVAEQGVILFHDFTIVIGAIFAAVASMPKGEHVAFLIEGSVFGLFLDPELVAGDPYLSAQYRKRRYHHHLIRAKFALRDAAPAPLVSLYRRLRSGTR